MLFKRPELTAGGRPVLSPDETLLFVQNNVGLYEGYSIDQLSRFNILLSYRCRKFKIGTCQNGQAYLTSHRAFYIDDSDPRQNSLSVDLRDVDRYESQVSFNSRCIHCMSDCM